jgi:hypothetical protein
MADKVEGQSKHSIADAAANLFLGPDDESNYKAIGDAVGPEVVAFHRGTRRLTVMAATIAGYPLYVVPVAAGYMYQFDRKHLIKEKIQALYSKKASKSLEDTLNKRAKAQKESAKAAGENTAKVQDQIRKAKEIIDGAPKEIEVILNELNTLGPEELKRQYGVPDPNNKLVKLFDKITGAIGSDNPPQGFEVTSYISDLVTVDNTKKRGALSSPQNMHTYLSELYATLLRSGQTRGQNQSGPGLSTRLGTSEIGIMQPKTPGKEMADKFSAFLNDNYKKGDAKTKNNLHHLLDELVPRLMVADRIIARRKAIVAGEAQLAVGTTAVPDGKTRNNLMDIVRADPNNDDFYVNERVMTDAENTEYRTQLENATNQMELAVTRTIDRMESVVASATPKKAAAVPPAAPAYLPEETRIIEAARAIINNPTAKIPESNLLALPTADTRVMTGAQVSQYDQLLMELNALATP